MARTGDNAVRENRDSEMFEIVGEAILAPVKKSAGLRGALEHQSAARADAESELVGFARAVDNFEGVVVKAGVDLHVGDGALHGEHVTQIRDRLERVERIVADTLAQDFPLRVVRGVAHFDAHEEAVELGFRKRIGAMMLDRVLRGDDKERLGEQLRSAVHADLGFVHGLEKGGLCARRGAIDFVGEHDIGEDRTGPKFKLARFGIVNADAKNVARKQIRSELDALEGAMKRFGESLSQGGLADARNIFDEQMAAGEQRDERELDGFFLAVDRACDGAPKLRDDLSSGSLHVLKTRALPATNRMTPRGIAVISLGD